MEISKNIIIQGKNIRLHFEEGSSVSNSYGNFDLNKMKAHRNIVYRSFNIKVKETAFAWEKDNSGRDEVQIMFNLNQDIKWFVKTDNSDYVNSVKADADTFITGSEKVEMAKGEVCIFRNNNFSTAMNYESGINFVFKSLQMPTEYFRELLSKYFLDENILRLENHLLNHVTKTVITPEMYRVLSEIDTAERFKEYESVYVEGKMIELTALVLYGVAYHKTDEIKRSVTVNKTDVEHMEKLREKIQRNPELQYDAMKVAKELGMSLSKLNRLFRSLYATSLHSYVQDKRLEFAARLIRDNDLPVSEAALKSGYTNMSHFSKAFSKKYGILPKNF